jgi:adenylate cyclase
VALLVANFTAATLVFVYLTFLSPRDEGAIDVGQLKLTNTAVFVAYMMLTLAFGAASSMWVGRHVLHWLGSERPADDHVRRAVLRGPLLQATTPLVYWLGAAVVFGTVNRDLGVGDTELQRIVLACFFGGLIASAFAYLIVERVMRPVVALALADELPSTSCGGLGILPRLLLSWLLGSAMPLLALGFTQIGRTPHERAQLTGPTLFLVGVGLFTGFCITFIAARQLSDPLARVRKALERVRSGDVDVSVAVDDGSEVGQLQVGFNAMAAGLRERERMRDLFGRYVGAEVARTALSQGVGLGGERREASALFVDLIGSTTLAAQSPPEEVVATLNALFGAVVRVVTEHGGWVNKFDGDGALAVFGPPADQPDHAARALRAARELRDELRRLAPHHPGLDAGIGVSSGTVVAGNVGAEQRYEYTVIGDPVNEAARLTVLAKRRPERLLASEAALRAADGEAPRWHEVGAETLRGRALPTEVYAPVG